MTAFRTLTLLLLAACAGAPDPKPLPEGEPVPGLEERMQQRQEEAASLNELNRVLLALDQALDSYATALANQGVSRADKQRESLEAFVRPLVADNFEKLVTTAADSSVPANQGIALAALGFSDRREAMAHVLQGAQLRNPDLVDKAVFGLAILQDPRTPPGVLEAIIDDEEMPDRTRIQAAWALHQIQTVSPREDEIVDFWKKVLARPVTVVHEGIVTQAVRGVGLTRQPENAPAVQKYASHPTPKVREATAIALGRMKNSDTVETLLAMIGPAEANVNVRLAARKALQALAGGVDREYDVEEWRRVFQLRR